jgi:hypothetical protein
LQHAGGLRSGGTLGRDLQCARKRTVGRQRLLLIGFAGRRRKLFRGAQMLGLVLLLAGGGIGLSGCSQRYGYLHHPPLTATGTAPGTYTINVAVDGSQGASAW